MMGRFLPLLLLVLLCQAEMPRDVVAREGSPALASAIRKRLQKAGIRAKGTSILVVRRGRDPQIRTTEGHGQALIPASVAKVMTAATALDLLGPGYVFRTRVTARGDLRDGVLEGDLVVHGVGDPHGLSGAGRDPTAALKALARQVRAAGVRQVRGSLVIDDLGFDRAFTHDAWTDEDKRRTYGAGVAAFAYHEGVFEIVATGSSASGRRAELRFPGTPGVFQVVNKTATRSSGRNVVGASFSNDGLQIHLTGSLKPRKRATARIPVPDPAIFAGGAFLHVLADSGVAVPNGLRRARDEGDAHPGREVASIETPIAPVLEHMNVESDNFYASMVFKACGMRLTGEGSWASGSRAVRSMLIGRGIEPGETLIVDGSGLSTTNRISAGVLVQVLLAFDEDPLRGPVLERTLPVSGVSGTLSRRLRERGVKGLVRAKTGTLNDVRVRALAGYVGSARASRDGHIFAILLNGRGASRVVVDDIVREIARR